MIASPARCFAVAALVALAHGAPPARAQAAPEALLTITAAAVSLPAGGTAEAIVTIALLPDHEILAGPPPTKWTTAASMAVVSTGGIVAKTPVFPASIKVRDPDGGKEIPVWKGRFEVRVPIEASAKAAPGNRSLRARFRYQARFEGEYYKVATREFKIPVTIVKAKKESAGTGGSAPATRP